MWKGLLCILFLGGGFMSKAEVPYEEVLDFWLGERIDETWPTEKAKLWFAKDEVLDREIKARFSQLLCAAEKGDLDAWKENPQSRLALILLTDQFSRNIHRNLPEAFATDAIALENTLEGMKAGEDVLLKPVERYFFYMPLMHAEDRSVQKLSLERFQNLVETSPKELSEMLSRALHYAHLHAEIIFRFGRYPHRNAILGRPSTPEEVAFLEGPNSSF